MYLEEGASLFGVSRHLEARGIPAPRGGKVWSVATLRGILTNPVYAGRIYAGRVPYRPPKIRRSATHPIGHPHDSAVALAPEEWIPVANVATVVSQEQFELATEKLSKNKSFARRNNKAHEYLLRALVSCGRCKLSSIARTQTGRNKTRKQRYYVCCGKQKQAQSGLDEKCPSPHAPADQLDELVWEDLCEVMTNPRSITDALRRAHGGHWLPQELKARQENLREGWASLGRQLERLTEAYLGEVIPLAEYERRRRDLEHRDEALSGQERQLRAQARQRTELAGVVGYVEGFCERVRSGLADATFEQRRKLVELLIDRVWQLVCLAFSFCWWAYGRLPTDEVAEKENDPTTADPEGRGKRRRLEVSWPEALRTVRGWLEPWVMLWRYWKAFSGMPPPKELQKLLDWLFWGRGLYLYVR